MSDDIDRAFERAREELDRLTDAKLAELKRAARSALADAADAVLPDRPLSDRLTGRLDPSAPPVERSFEHDGVRLFNGPPLTLYAITSLDRLGALVEIDETATALRLAAAVYRYAEETERARRALVDFVRLEVEPVFEAHEQHRRNVEAIKQDVKARLGVARYEGTAEVYFGGNLMEAQPVWQAPVVDAEAWNRAAESMHAVVDKYDREKLGYVSPPLAGDRTLEEEARAVSDLEYLRGLLGERIDWAAGVSVCAIRSATADRPETERCVERGWLHFTRDDVRLSALGARVLAGEVAP